MIARLLAASALAATLSGCASFSRRGLDPDLVARASADAAAQVKRCYRSPRVAGDARRIATRLQVRFAPDGQVIGVPVVLGQSGVTPANQAYAGTMARAAIASVLACAPLRFPPEISAVGASDFQLTFSASLRG